MATKYFLYSSEQIKENNQILARSSKEFVPGVVTVSGTRKKFTQLSNTPSNPRYIDAKIVASGELNDFTYTKPTTAVKKG